MHDKIKRALNRVHADPALVQQTQNRLMDAISNVNGNPSPDINRPLTDRFVTLVLRRRLQRMAFAGLCVAAMALLAILGARWMPPSSSGVQTYLWVDINPSIELAISGQGQVVQATAYNDDGKTVLQGQHLEGLSVEDAVADIVDIAAQKGYVAEDGSSIIEISTPENNDTQTNQKVQRLAQKGVDRAIKKRQMLAAVVTDNVAQVRIQEARKIGITPGKLNLIQKLQAADPTVKVEDVKDQSVKDIMKRFVATKKQDKKINDAWATQQNNIKKRAGHKGKGPFASLEPTPDGTLSPNSTITPSPFDPKNRPTPHPNVTHKPRKSPGPRPNGSPKPDFSPRPFQTPLPSFIPRPLPSRLPVGTLPPPATQPPDREG